MSIRTLIPATSRNRLPRPVAIVTLDGEWDDTAEIHRAKVRSFLAYANEVAAAEVDSLTDWTYEATDRDGYTHKFYFDGIEVLRRISVRDGDTLSAIMGISNAERRANTGKPFADGTPSPMADATPIPVSPRADAARQNYVRKSVALAMGFDGIKAWKRAGSPIDSEVLPPKVRAMLSELQAGSVASVKGIRTNYQNTGRYQGHSHNN
jgi:hypothetical protein